MVGTSTDVSRGGGRAAPERRVSASPAAAPAGPVRGDARGRPRASRRIGPRRIAVLAVALGGVTVLGAGGPAPAAHAARRSARGRVIVRPRPGAHVRRNTVRIAVRAGKEWSDLSARLNGHEVGREFSRTDNGLRVLRASTSHGLRWGDNVLRVRARRVRGGRERRATVHFRVVPHHPLVGAGRHRRMPVGTTVRLKGRVRAHHARRRLKAKRRRLSARRRHLRLRMRASRRRLRTHGPVSFTGSLRSTHRRLRSTERRLRSVRRRLRSARRAGARARWTVISAPIASRYAKRGATAAGAPKTLPSTPIGPPGAPKTLPLTPIGPPVATVKVPLKPLGPPSVPAARFHPTALGTYKLALTVGTGKRAVTTTTSVDAVPRSGAQWIDTEDDSESVPGIQVGDTDYTAPPLARDKNGKPEWWGDGFYPVFQILALDRATLAKVFNRTYGSCFATNGVSYPCRLVSGDDPTAADISSDLAALDDSTMVIVRAHRGGGWRSPYVFVRGPAALLAPIGFPSNLAPAQAGAGTLSAIGVPGMAAGEASVKFVDGNGISGEMRGFLGVDPNHHFGFMPAARPQFDTRNADKSSCSSATCTVTQTVGDQTATGTIPNGQGGFLVAAYDPHSLRLDGSAVFATTDDRIASGHLAEVSGMHRFLTRWALRRSVIAITSIRTPALGARPLTDPVPPQYQKAAQSDWAALATDVANVGGTRDKFNTSTASTKSLYSLIAGPGAKPSQGRQIADANGRLRGALVPDTLSEFQPTDVVANGPPAELLPQLIVRKPVTTWPLDGTPAQRALRWIGGQVPFLGPYPRSAYWDQSWEKPPKHLIDQINAVDYKPGHDFTAADFATAKAELANEVVSVERVRTYLSLLSSPENKVGGGAWEDATKLNHKLTAELSGLKKKGQVEFAWFNVAASLLDLVGGFAEAGSAVATVVKTFSSATKLSGSLSGALWDGSPANGAQRTVEADQLATQLEEDADQTQHAYERMGDMIVSDPTKLKELGKWARCNRYGGCGDKGQYEQLAFPDGAPSMMGAAAERAIDRVLYERLVPLAFPVWNTGTWNDPDPAKFKCEYSNYFNNPFGYSPPPRAYTSVLISLDPRGPGSRAANLNNFWRTYMDVARSGHTYGFPSKQILDRMYDPVATSDDPLQGGLGMSPQDVLPYATPVYKPPSDTACGWGV